MVVDEDCEEMVTLFHVTGSLLYVSEDNDDEVIGFDDVFTKVSVYFSKTVFRSPTIFICSTDFSLFLSWRKLEIGMRNVDWGENMLISTFDDLFMDRELPYERNHAHVMM